VTKLKVLILAAKPVGHGQLFTGELESPLLIPFRGKPLVMHFEEQFNNFEIVYALGESAFKTQSLVKMRYPKSTFIKVPEEVAIGSTGDCLLFCLSELAFPNNVLTIHADNIYEFKDFPTQISNNINYTYQIESRNKNYTYYNRLSESDDTSEIGFQKSENWVNTGAHFIKNSIQIDRRKGASIDFLLGDADFIGLNEWIDLGHWDLINRSNISLHTRSFNTMSLSSDKSSIVKSSSKIKIFSEFEHFSNIPEEFSFLFPRVKSVDEIQGYEIEFWPLKSLSEYLVFWNMDLPTWIKILEKLLTLIERFATYKMASTDLKATFTDVYEKMLMQRIEEYSQECLEILNYDCILFNGVEFKGYAAYAHDLHEDLRRISQDIKPSFYHGDLYLGNVLYHPVSEILKLIDPKGSLIPDNSNFGDFRYDLAKLSHSVIGEFDYFNWSMFSLSQIGNEFTINLFKQSNSRVLEEKFQQMLLEFHSKETCRDVEILTAMLFLSMVPLHSDSAERQKGLLIQGVRLLNQIYLEW